MEKNKKGKVSEKFKLLNPKNLEKEVHAYGYNFSWKTHIILMLLVLAGISGVGIVFQLKASYLAVVIVATFIVLPLLVLNTYRKMYEQKRFSDVTTYMEQVLYSFQKLQKTASALKETREVFEDGQMRSALDAAIAYLEAGTAVTEKGLLRESLEFVEHIYGCPKLRMVHELLISTEEYGGEMDRAFMLVLEDIELWKRRGYKLQKNKKTSHMDNIISIVVSTVLCAVALYVLNGMKELFAVEHALNIFQVGIIQISSVLFIIFMLYVFAKSSGNLTKNWLEETAKESDDVLRSYTFVVNYDGRKEGKKSLLWALPFFVGSITACLFHQLWFAIGCAGLILFMLLQHKVGYNMAKKDVTEALYMALPGWLMQIALLLQYNNVQVSIAKSIPGTSPVLKPELTKLLERLQKEPESLASYTQFCRAFDIPEAQSCMKMLHAMSESGTGNAGIQTANLMQRVGEMQNMADEIRDAEIAFRMRMVFSYPVLAATIKLLIDLTVGMLYMFQMLGGMGGVG